MPENGREDYGWRRRSVAVDSTEPESATIQRDGAPRESVETRYHGLSFLSLNENKLKKEGQAMITQQRLSGTNRDSPAIDPAFKVSSEAGVSMD